MFIHIGNRKTVSGHRCVGIFNTESLRGSDVNKWLTDALARDDKTLALLTDGQVITSEVSPFTVIKRTMEEMDEFIWRRDNDENVQRG